MRTAGSYERERVDSGCVRQARHSLTLVATPARKGFSRSAASDRYSNRGFALVLTLVLLSLLVLLILAMTALVRLESRQISVAVPQVQAQQNALLALRVALAELQRHAGPDDRVTGMAGITGIPADAGQSARHWCGVWRSDGSFAAWLASGAEGNAIPSLTGPDAVALLSSGALGADGTDKEHVRVRKVPIEEVDPQGERRVTGHYAYWIGDEGVKLSVGDAGYPQIEPTVHPALDEILAGFPLGAPRLSSVLTYEQLAFVPQPALTPGPLQANRHSLTVAHLSLTGTPAGPQLRAGALNINTTNARVWRAVAATYDRLRPDAPLGITSMTFANRMRNGFTAAASHGKDPSGPFLTPEAFAQSTLLAAGLKGSGVKPQDFTEAMGHLFTARTDTFCLRAYGDATSVLSPAGPPVGVAVAEVFVQRMPDALPGQGRRLLVTRFRWLGAEDL